MQSLSLPVLFSVVGTLLIVAIYFVWARRTNKP
jgi:hypothetical protein